MPVHRRCIEEDLPARCGRRRVSLFLSLKGPTAAAIGVAVLLCYVTVRGSLVAHLTIEVQHPGGRPAQDVSVQHVQLERYSIHNHLLSRTDAKGRIEVQFQEVSNQSHPLGYGVHRFVVMPEDFRWEVSDMYVWTEAQSSPLGNDSVERYRALGRDTAESNWSRGEVWRILADQDLRWSVTLQPGPRTRIHVVDQFGRPLPNRTLSVTLDLGALSHTGWGGAVPVNTLETDAQGTCLLPHAGPWVYSFELHDSGYCVPGYPFWTPVAKERPNGGALRLVYHKPERKPIAFKVTDARSGQPVADALVWVEMSYACMVQGGPIGKTDADGVWRSDTFTTDHVVRFGVHKEGFEDARYDIGAYHWDKTYNVPLRALNMQTEERGSSEDHGSED